MKLQKGKCSALDNSTVNKQPAFSLAVVFPYLTVSPTNGRRSPQPRAPSAICTVEGEAVSALHSRAALQVSGEHEMCARLRPGTGQAVPAAGAKGKGHFYRQQSPKAEISPVF